MLTKTDIEKYFIAEKQASLLFLIIGIVAIIIAIILVLVYKNNFWRGAAIPLITIGLIQIIVGFTIYKRSDADRVRVVYAYDLNPNDLRAKELPRIQTVNKNFIVYKWIEIALILIGTILIIKFKSTAVYENNWIGNAFWYGLGIALTLQSLLVLSSDYFAEKRALNYEMLLKQKIEKSLENK